MSTNNIEAIGFWDFSDLRELIDVLGFARAAALKIDPAAVLYVASDGFDCADVEGRVVLYEQRLTDGSTAYDIRIGDIPEGWTHEEPIAA